MSMAFNICMLIDCFLCKQCGLLAVSEYITPFLVVVESAPCFIVIMKVLTDVLIILDHVLWLTTIVLFWLVLYILVYITSQTA